MPEKPITLGKYTLGEILGAGGFGTVYKATDPSGRTVAIKVLKPGWNDDPGAIERFRREAQVAGELFHSRIATIIDFDEADGRLYLVMRYIDGVPLDKLIKQKGRLTWEETIQILEQVAEGLDYAHQRGLVHRDIKPANILVSEKDGAVITDFGLVKAADASGMSTTGVMLGTPHYIAPEIWEGKPATAQTDIYSLACVAYEMLTGQVLFDGKSPPEVMTKHVRGINFTEQSWPSNIPRGIAGIFSKALGRDSTKLYAKAMDFVIDLEGQLRPKLVQPITTAIHPSTNWWKLAATGMFVIIFAGLLLVSFSQIARRNPEATITATLTNTLSPTIQILPSYTSTASITVSPTLLPSTKTPVPSLTPTVTVIVTPSIPDNFTCTWSTFEIIEFLSENSYRIKTYQTFCTCTLIECSCTVKSWDEKKNEWQYSEPYKYDRVKAYSTGKCK